MGQYERHVFVCTQGDSCPAQGDVEKFVKTLRTAVAAAGRHVENVWYGGVQESDLPEILESHILNGVPVKRLVYDPGVKGANKVKEKEKK
jgi:(2Fe-2S) ferredoxin